MKGYRYAKLAILPAIVVASSAFIALAPTQEFSLKDPKAVNSIQWLLDSPLEPIAGSAHAIDGTIVFDPQNPEKTTGKVVVDVTSMKAPVDLMSTHLKSEMWLDAAKYPTIEFAIKKIQPTKRAGVGFRKNHALVTGDLTIHGVTKEVTAPVDWTTVPGGLDPKMHGQMKGDLFNLRTEFKVKRSDYGIGPKELGTDLVSDDVEIRVAIIAVAPVK